MVELIELPEKQSKIDHEEVMSFEIFDKMKHYEMLCDWWRGHKWNPVPVGALPSNGIIVNYNNKPVCSGFLYQSDSTLAWMEWIVCDPKAKREYRGDCIDSLISQLVKLAGLLGAQSVVSSVVNSGLIARLKKHDFCVTDKNMTNLIKVL